MTRSKPGCLSRQTGMGTSLRVEVRHLMISGEHQTAGTSQTTEPGEGWVGGGWWGG